MLEKKILRDKTDADGSPARFAIILSSRKKKDGRLAADRISTLVL